MDTTSHFEIRKGLEVECLGRAYVITRITSLEQVLAKNLATSEIEPLFIKDLVPVKNSTGADQKKSEIDLEGVSQEDWDEAKRRLEIISPLLGQSEWGTASVVVAAKNADIGQATLYRWIREYRGSGLLSSLLPTKPSGGKGKARLNNAEVEAIIDSVIENFYMTDAHPSIAATHEQICIKCGPDLPHPHYQTVRRRIEWKSGRAMTKSRYGEKVARELHDANEGQIPDAGWPLALVQIDHTELPIMVVHEETRQVIGRPWVTFAIDVNSRVIPGMYLSLDHPSALSAGMCLSHAILPKERWLADRGIEADWPCWGVMGIIHCDNAKEFRGNMLKAACNEYAIDLHLRPVKTPHYGAHIERLMGTVSEELKKVPGTTFSNPKEKFEYDSEGNAIMTMAELERWLTYFIARYHHRLHKGLGTSPLARYKEGLLGANGRPGRGLPARRLDSEKVRVDFMPYEERTIQDYGVQWDLTYFDDVLRPWVNATDPTNPKLKRLFRFRRDPRDITVIYFFEPNVKRYFPIRHRNLSQPSISYWEYKEGKKAAKKAGLAGINDETVFFYVKKQREEVEEARKKTKAARRQHQKQLEHTKAKKAKKVDLKKTYSHPVPEAPPPSIPGYNPDKVSAYDDD